MIRQPSGEIIIRPDDQLNILNRLYYYNPKEQTMYTVSTLLGYKNWIKASLRLILNSFKTLFRYLPSITTTAAGLATTATLYTVNKTPEVVEKVIGAVNGYVYDKLKTATRIVDRVSGVINAISNLITDPVIISLLVIIYILKQ